MRITQNLTGCLFRIREQTISVLVYSVDVVLPYAFVVHTHREMALALVLDCVLVMMDIKDLCVMSVQMAIINKLLEISNSVTVSTKQDLFFIFPSFIRIHCNSLDEIVRKKDLYMTL